MRGEKIMRGRLSGHVTYGNETPVVYVYYAHDEMFVDQCDYDYPISLQPWSSEYCSIPCGWKTL